MPCLLFWHGFSPSWLCSLSLFHGGWGFVFTQAANSFANTKPQGNLETNYPVSKYSRLAQTPDRGVKAVHQTHSLILYLRSKSSPENRQGTLCYCVQSYSGCVNTLDFFVVCLFSVFFFFLRTWRFLFLHWSTGWAHIEFFK